MGWMYDWFHDTLRWPLLRLGQGALTLLAEAGASVMDESPERIDWLRDQFTPKTCINDHLLGHGESRGILQLASEDANQFRTRIVAAWEWHMLSGKQLGMPIVLQYYGFPLTTIENERINDPTRWAEFWAETAERGLRDQAEWLLWIWHINDIKPARSRLRGLRFYYESHETIYVGGGVRQSARLTIKANRSPVVYDVVYAGGVIGEHRRIGIKAATVTTIEGSLTGDTTLTGAVDADTIFEGVVEELEY